MSNLRVLDLFSGIGGFSLGLERAGMETVALAECEPYARRVLRKHWPAVPLFEDVRTLSKRRLHKEGIDPNVIVGGFPCQDISMAGKGAGIEGSRSGLWAEFARLIREIRPAYVVAENVAALRWKGLGRVLGDLHAIGYDAEWQVVSAADLGAPHLRERIWIVAYPAGLRRGMPGPVVRPRQPDFAGGAARQQGQGRQGRGPWQHPPRIQRVAHGIPSQVDRLRCLGNAVVPQVVELIGRAIVGHHNAVTESAA